MISKDAGPASSGKNRNLRRLTAAIIGIALLITVVIVAPKAWDALIVAVPATWSWFLRQDITPGRGTIIGGFFVVVAAAIAYTGTHLTRTSNQRNADRSHNRADLQELRRRFVSTTAQFADLSPEVRLAGVYALEALTDDWIERGRHTDAQTCINYLCGYLTRPYTPPTENPTLRRRTTRTYRTKYDYTDNVYEHPKDDLNVRQAITRTIANHLPPNHHHSWSNYNYDLTGAYFHNADFTGCHFRGAIDFTGANFHGEQTSFDNAKFLGSQTSFSQARFQSNKTSFDNAKFYSNRTLFNFAQFSSQRVYFDQAEFRGELTSFNNADFDGEETSFSYAKFKSTWQTSFFFVDFHSSSETSFTFAEFRGKHAFFSHALFYGKYTSFVSAKFNSKETSFDFTDFHGEETRFYRAQFLSTKTSFVFPRSWNNVYFDWDTPVPYAATAPKSDKIVPHHWPPPTLEQND
ncbi:hypothetical protein CH274_24565 [Rhodococcus sp. 06-418-5]|uniref:pentapeptide repeat-containing protein n=1 Tax=Rhodococcus sp. 06-418-5 TaxID=2022507 RepID=UPI000B9B310F|nr:pentapeptide repeat-containing protein [Rhodococcus sp. 06-418-5]OZC73742.1 hypothetical protein CH274_24565 [Rhodococcus sp. 06-418-5]